MIAPSTMRMEGVMRLFSKEYFTRKTTPRKRTNPPSQAKSFTPRKPSQSIGGFAAGRGAGVGATGVGLAAAGETTAVGNGGGTAAAFAATGAGTGAFCDSRDVTRCASVRSLESSTRRRFRCAMTTARTVKNATRRSAKPQLTNASMILICELHNPVGAARNSHGNWKRSATCAASAFTPKVSVA